MSDNQHQHLHFSKEETLAKDEKMTMVETEVDDSL